MGKSRSVYYVDTNVFFTACDPLRRGHICAYRFLVSCNRKKCITSTLTHEEILHVIRKFQYVRPIEVCVRQFYGVVGKVKPVKSEKLMGILIDRRVPLKRYLRDAVHAYTALNHHAIIVTFDTGNFTYIRDRLGLNIMVKTPCEVVK